MNHAVTAGLPELIEADRNHWVHPVAPLRQHERRGATIWKSADRVFLTDFTGHQVLDGFSGLWCVNAGYGHPSIAAAATRQLETLPYATGYFHFASEPAIRLAARLAELAPPGLSRVFFTQGGSDAVDTAIKLIRYYFNATNRPSKRHFIAVGRGYHGSSSRGAGLTALPVFHRYFDSPDPHQHHIPSPYPYRHEAGPDPEAVLASTLDALERKANELGRENVAAFFCEPVLGSGGVIIPPAGYLKAVRELCTRLGILMVADEVITGFGRTGPLFSCLGEGVSPDLMTIAKGLTSGYAPMGATMISEEIYAGIADGAPDGAPLGHGQTYAGHPVSAAIGNAVLDLYLEGGLIENGQKVGKYFERRLHEFDDHPLVGEVRVRGMLGAIELVTNKATKQKPEPGMGLGQEILRRAWDEGLVFRAFPDDILGFAPSLNYTTADVDMLIERLRRAIDKATR